MNCRRVLVCYEIVQSFEAIVSECFGGRVMCREIRITRRSRAGIRRSEALDYF